MGVILGGERLGLNVNQPPLSSSVRRSPIKVAMLSLPPRTQSLLEFFFSNAGRAAFVASVEEQAETAIFDLDTPSSHQHWLSFHARTGRPGIALAVKPHEVDGALWVQKPVTPAALLGAATTLQASTPVVPAQAPAATAPSPSLHVAAAEAQVQATVMRPPPAMPTRSERLPEPPVEPPVVTEVLLASETKPLPAAPRSVESGNSRLSKAPAPAASATLEHEHAIPATDAADPPMTVDSMGQGHTEPPAEAPPPADGAPAPGLLGIWRRFIGVPQSGSSTAPALTPAPKEVSAGTVASRTSAAPPPEQSPDREDEPELRLSPQTAQQLELSEPDADESAADLEEAPLDAPPMRDALIDTQRRLPAADAVVDAARCTIPEAPGVFFGNRPEHSAQELAQTNALHYDPETYLVGQLREAYLVSSKWQVPTQFDCGRGLIVVDAERNDLCCNFSRHDLEDLYREPMPRRSKVHTLTAQEYDRFKQSAHALGHATRLRLDDQVWRAALAASAGRMPAKGDASRTVYLLHWPNLTRITAVPHAARIAALWALRGASVVETAKQLGIAQKYVIGFYSAAWALNLLTEDGSHVRRAQRKHARNRGLLSRLIGWLRR